MSPFPDVSRPLSTRSSRIARSFRRLVGVLPAIAALLLLGAPRALASPIGFQVDYLTTGGESCIRAFCFPLTPGTTFQKTFSLDSAQLAAPGSYDVLASLSPPYPSIPGTTSLTLNATAVVSGGAVTDFVLHYSVSASNTVPILGTTYTSSTFDASGGTWSSSDSSFNSLSNSSGNAHGTYTVTQVPEPTSLALASLGLLGMTAQRRRGARARRSGIRG